MVQITENVIRKRAEHNNCEIFSLEELSLHQQDIEKIEHIEKWCRELKILYLQNNLIGRIENVGRLKKLEYLNLALNNIEKVENLQNCESLKKLDLTVNFVGELTSIESLKKNIFLEDLYLTGNPCTQFEGYQEYVIATLPQLKWIDGHEIEKSERIKAMQEIEEIRKSILTQQQSYLQKRLEQKEDFEKETKEKNQISDSDKSELDEESKQKKEEEFWSEKVDYTPESRTLIQNKLQENREKTAETKFKEPTNEKRRHRLFNDEGNPMNVNEAKVDFTLTETEDDCSLILDVACWKYLDTSLIDADVQPWYVRVTMKGAILQLVLMDEVKPDSSTAQRSQTTGHLIITMPKLYPPPVPAKKPNENTLGKATEKTSTERNSKYERETLEVKQGRTFFNELANITRKCDKVNSARKPVKKVEVSNSPDFVDDPDVPPLI
uniref:Leucine-rich repeat-containing protein 6 n=1 Tax=Phallusia mammillata TaxID=59560 RepID=A0A6F9DKL9_9ASCI|nr:protein tilB homolog [Phallusia mammillata]